MQLSPCEHRLQQVARIHCAVRLARSYNGMKLVYKKQDFPFRRLDFIQHGFQAFFKFSAEFCARNKRSHIQRKDGFIL